MLLALTAKAVALLFLLAFADNTPCKNGSCTFFMMVMQVAGAACIDPPAAIVDWYLCVKNNEMFRDGQTLGSSNLPLIGLNRAQLQFANLAGSNSSRAHVRSQFNGCHLKGEKMSGAIFTDTVLYAADLTDTDLRGAKLNRTNLINAKLKNADLTGTLWTDGKHFCGEGSIGVCKLQSLAE